MKIGPGFRDRRAWGIAGMIVMAALFVACTANGMGMWTYP